MSIIEAIILGIAQGLTEFIPVSSSGHLLLLHDALDIEAAGLAFDVALHSGTLLALTIFFYRDIAELVGAIFHKNEKTGLAWLLAFATIPAVIAGVILEDSAETTFRSSLLVGCTLIFVGLLMLLAEKQAENRSQKTGLTHVNWKQGLAIGVAQAVALVPGVSRSGATITTGIFAGLDRVAATRFSFLLAIPITFGAITKVLITDGAVAQSNGEEWLFLVGIISAFLSGLFAIRFLLKYLSKHSLAVFAYYRIALGLLVFLLLAI